MIVFVVLGKTWLRCGGPFGMSAPVAASLADALAIGGGVAMVVLLQALPARAPDGADGAGRRGRRPWDALGRPLRPEGDITLGRGLFSGAALLFLVWHSSVNGYERGLRLVERGACPAAEAPARDR